MPEQLLATIGKKELSIERRDPVDRDTLEIARGIIEDIRNRGEKALREHALRFGDIAAPTAPLLLDKDELSRSLSRVTGEERALLERTANRIRIFAQAQRDSIREFELPIPGGTAGQVVAPVERAGCYAPGGRFPLPSSVLMTVVTARVAGVSEVIVASPKPAPITLAAAAIAGADALLTVGGAQAVAALAFGAGAVPSCDVIAGPGNRFVTAAKQLVAGRVGIDMLAGPSELTVLADDSANPTIVAADLLAQAEHDPDAVPILVTTSKDLIAKVNAALKEQLDELPTRETAAAALKNGSAVLVDTLDEAIEVCNILAPEHLELHVTNASAAASACKHYGALFIGSGAAEVLGDYGAGPNHTLPTSGTARYSGGLSVFDFLRIRTTLRSDGESPDDELLKDSEQLALLEGLHAHSRAATIRATDKSDSK